MKLNFLQKSFGFFTYFYTLKPTWGLFINFVLNKRMHLDSWITPNFLYIKEKNMNGSFKYIVLFFLLVFTNLIYSQDCEGCATYNVQLGCYAVAVYDDPNATNYCPADYYINSGSQFCEYAGGCFCEDALNFGSSEDCLLAEGWSDPLAAKYTDCANSTIITETRF